MSLITNDAIMQHFGYPGAVNDKVRAFFNALYTGSGSPEGVITANTGAFYLDTTNGALYAKQSGSGNTGWIAGIAPGSGSGPYGTIGVNAPRSVTDAAYGAVAGARQPGDATILIGSLSTLSSPSSHFLTTATVGMVIGVFGAGAAGVMHATTIAAVVDDTHLTLTSPAITAVAAATFLYGTDATAGIQAAFNTQRAITLPDGEYIITSTIRPLKNGQITALGKVNLRVVPTGTFTAIKDAAGADTGKRVVFDHSQFSRGVVSGINIFGDNSAGLVAWAASEEYANANTYSPQNTFKKCQAWQCEWAIYGTNDGVNAIGSLAGNNYEDFESHCPNFVHLGQQSSDDVTFSGATRAVGCTGYGVQKIGGHDPHFDDLYLSTSGTAAIAIEIDGFGCSIDHLFLESNDGSVPAGCIVTHGTTNPASIDVRNYHHNMPNGTKLVRVLGLSDQVTIGQCPDKNWNGAKAASLLLSVEYTTGQAMAALVRIGYGGTDAQDGATVAFSSSDATFNALLTSVVRLGTVAGEVVYRGTVVLPTGVFAPTFFPSGRYVFANGTVGPGTSATLGNQTLRSQPFFVPKPLTLAAIGAEVTSIGDAGRSVADMVTNATTTITSATAAFVTTDQGRGVTGTNIPAGTYIASVTNATTAVLTQAATGSGSGGSLTISGCVVRLGIYYDNGAGYPSRLLLDAGTIDGHSATVQDIAINQTLSPGMWWLAAVVQGVTTTQPTLRTIGTLRFDLPLLTTTPTAAATALGYQQATVTNGLPTDFTATPALSGQGARLHLKVA